MNDIEGLREASEWALRELEAGKPKPTRNVFRALLLAWGLKSTEYHAWARQHAKDIELRWSRLRALWAGEIESFVRANKHRMTNQAMAEALGVHKGTIVNHIRMVRHRKVSGKKMNIKREISAEMADVIDAFATAVYGMVRRKIPDPDIAYQRAVARFRAAGVAEKGVSNIIRLHRPDAYALYVDLLRRRAANLLRIGLAEGHVAMAKAGDLNDNSCRTVLSKVKRGLPYFGIALRDGELVDLKRWEAEHGR